MLLKINANVTAIILLSITRLVVLPLLVLVVSQGLYVVTCLHPPIADAEAFFVGPGAAKFPKASGPDHNPEVIRRGAPAVT